MLTRIGRIVRPSPPPPAARRARDSQRSRLYRAEHAVFMRDATLPLPAFGWLTSMEAARRFVADVAAHPAVIARYPHPERAGRSLLDGLAVADGRGRRSACAYVGRHAIALPQALRMRWVAVHECAHVIAGALHRAEPGYAAHGADFAHVYVTLVEAVFGADIARALAQSFGAHGVRWATVAALRAAA